MSTPASQLPQAFGAGKASDAFWYTASVAGLSSVAPNGNALVNMDGDSYFWCVALTAVANIAGAAYTESTAPLPLVAIQIADTGTGKTLMNASVLIPGMFGDGKRPYRFVKPRVFNPNATVQFTFDASLMAAGTTYGIQVIMHGWKQLLSGLNS